jgi:N-acetylglucosamine-6-phosphate deacetylase
MNMYTAVINAKIVLPDGITDGNILVENEKILAVGKVLPPKDSRIIDVKGAYAGPGYIDIHCHGGGEYNAHEKPYEAGRCHLNSGTTSQILSLAYNLSKEEFFSGIENIKKAMLRPDNNIAGIHFEGPYTNPKYGAAAKKAWKLDKEDYIGMFDIAKGLVLQCTFAPELPGIDEYAGYARTQGIALAAGHTEMSPEILEKAVENGVTIVTHLFDAMGCHLGNESISCTGIIQDTAADAVLARNDLYVELICDSRAIHVKPSNLRLAVKAAGADKVILITDYSYSSHNPSDYPQDDIRSSIDLNFNEAGELSGSKLTMELACRNMKQHTNSSVLDIFKMASRNPAMAMGIYDTVGSLEAGKYADIVICDENMIIEQVYFKGMPVRI